MAETTTTLITTDSQSPDRELVYPTRFGEVRLREDRLLSFPVGILGFPHCTVFGLSHMPDNSASPILLLQSVNEPGLSFLVADPAMLGVTIADADRQEALKELGLTSAATQLLVILTLHDNHGEGYFLTANTKAPLCIDSQSRVGYQYIFHNKAYSTQHKV